MRKPGTDESNVNMSDVICDFCHSEWVAEKPMIEGHHGSCICGNCLSLAYAEVVIQHDASTTSGYTCRMCLEGDEDRAALDRGDEPGWKSPVHDEAVVCQRCIMLAVKSLRRDKDFDWKDPTG